MTPSSSRHYDALLRRFSRLDLPAGKFPEEPAVFLLRPLANQEIVPLPDDRRRYFHHSSSRHASEWAQYPLIYLILYNAVSVVASILSKNTKMAGKSAVHDLVEDHEVYEAVGVILTSTKKLTEHLIFRLLCLWQCNF